MFTIGEVFPLEEEPDPDLLVQIGWKADLYNFEFLEADILAAEGSTASWVEIAFSRQLGGAFAFCGAAACPRWKLRGAPVMVGLKAMTLSQSLKP